MKETVYISFNKNTIVTDSRITIGSIADVWCSDKNVTAKVRALLIANAPDVKSRRYVFSAIDIIKIIQQQVEGVDVNALGEPDFVISYKKFFLFFISQNSLSSNMVKLEWQNALFRKAKERIVFIPIRMDNSILPAILTQNLYIDLYFQGLDVAIRQIVDVIEGNNTYRGPQQQFSNMVAYKYKEENKIIIECHAEHFLEPISSFMFCTSHDSNDINATVRNELAYYTNNKNGAMLGNETINYVERGISKGTAPHFPFVVELSSKTGIDFDIKYVLHEKERGKFFPIPIINGKKNN